MSHSARLTWNSRAVGPLVSDMPTGAKSNALRKRSSLSRRAASVACCSRRSIPVQTTYSTAPAESTMLESVQRIGMRSPSLDTQRCSPSLSHVRVLDGPRRSRFCRALAALGWYEHVPELRALDLVCENPEIRSQAGLKRRIRPSRSSRTRSASVVSNTTDAKSWTASTAAGCHGLPCISRLVCRQSGGLH